MSKGYECAYNSNVHMCLVLLGVTKRLVAEIDTTFMLMGVENQVSDYVNETVSSLTKHYIKKFKL